MKTGEKSKASMDCFRPGLNGFSIEYGEKRLDPSELQFELAPPLMAQVALDRFVPLQSRQQVHVPVAVLFRGSDCIDGGP